jgi:hypothetical protein
MNKYEWTRGGMRSLELLMTLMASYQEIKQKNSERTAMLESRTHNQLECTRRSAGESGRSRLSELVRRETKTNSLATAISPVCTSAEQ